MEDVVVVGGSFAGLTAAMHVARALRKVTIIDSGLPRNRFASGAHNVLGFDGVSPLAIRDAGRANVLAYPTATFVAGEAVSARRKGEDFVVQLGDGREIAARRLVLSYGVRDIFPAIDGFAECWGRTVLHCPYCHGYEVAGGRLGLLYTSPLSLHFLSLMADWGDDRTLLTNGAELSDDDLGKLAARGIKVVPGRVAALVHENGAIRTARIEDGREVALDALFAHPNVVPSADLHTQLGVEMLEGPQGPYVKVDANFATSQPGIYAAGDLSNPRASVNAALAAGTLAGVSAHQSLIDWG